MVMYRFGVDLQQSKGNNRYVMYKLTRNAVTMHKSFLQQTCANALHGEGRIVGIDKLSEDVDLPEPRLAIQR